MEDVQRILVSIPNVGEFYRLTAEAPWKETYVLGFESPADAEPLAKPSRRWALGSLVTLLGTLIAWASFK